MKPEAVSVPDPSSWATPKSATGAAVAVEEHVRRLDVAVHDAPLVGVSKASARAARRPRPLGRQRGGGDGVGQRSAVDALEDEERPFVELAVAQDLHDVRVLERLEGGDLPPNRAAGRGRRGGGP